MKTIRQFAVLVTFSVVLQANASPICPSSPPDSNQEGVWRIPEEAFTEDAARKALAKLEQLFGPDGVLVDSGVWATHFIYVEGWYLKRQAQEAITRGDPEPFVSDFCEFMRERAFVRH